jgi:hypothetical protein
MSLNASYLDNVDLTDVRSRIEADAPERSGTAILVDTPVSRV